jgi:membrane protease YdiL (CAAX protease family)
LLLGGAVYFLIFPGTFDPELTTLRQLSAAGGASGLSESSLLTIQFLTVVIIGPVVNIIPTMGEELGWRGYLLPIA